MLELYIYIYIEIGIRTISEELHAKRKLTFEGFYLQPFFFETGEEFFETESFIGGLEVKSKL